MLSKFSVKKTFTVFAAIIIVIVFGAVAVYKMTPELFPEINTPYAVVMTTYPGASAEEAETEVTEPLEKQLATLSNVKNVTSISSDNYSVVSLEFTGEVDMDAISVDIRDKIDQIEGNLPEGAATPVVMKINLDMMPVTVAAVSVKGSTPAKVSTLYKEELESSLEGIDGVASVNSMGLVDDGARIVLSQDKIDKVNEEVSNAILAKTGAGKGKIKSGISKAKRGKSQIEDGKDLIWASQGLSASMIASARSRLVEQKEQLNEVKDLNKEYLKAKASGDEAAIAAYEAQITEAFGSVEAFEEIATDADSSIKAINNALRDLDEQQMSITAYTGNTYSELTGMDSTLNATVGQLQSALSQVESQEKAAVDSADMTGVITMENVSAILNAQNFSMPAGYVTDGKAKVLVSVGDKLKSTDELENLVLFDMGIDGLDPIKVKDIGTVTYIADDSENYARINGENGVLLSFTKQSSYATAEVSDNIQAKFKSLGKEYDGLKFTTMMDQGESIYMVIHSVLNNLLLGALLAIVILLFFLRDIRPTVITAISIPVSVMFALALMYFSGVTLNMISLSGLAIGVGMLVDNSIVVIENIYRLRSLGYSAVQAAVSGAGQVAGAITASTLTTICVFAPIVFVDGMTRDLFTDLALTVAYSLLASLIIALTLVPAMAKGLLKKKAGKTVFGQKGRIVSKYREIVAWSLNHSKTVIICGIGILILSAGLLLSRGFEFMPSMSNPQISAQITMPEDSTMEDTVRVNDEIADAVSKIDGVEDVGAMLSSNTMGMMGMSAADTDTRNTSMYIMMNEDKLENTKKVSKKLDAFAKKYDCEIITSADMDMSTMMGGSDISITLYGEELDTLRKTGKNIESHMREMNALEEVSDVGESSTEEIHISVNKNSAMKHGLTVAQVYQQISAKLQENKEATTINQDEGNITVSVENTTKDKFTVKDLENMMLTAGTQGQSTESKEKVKLSKISSISKDASMNVINHDGQKRSLEVTASLKDGYNITKATNDVKSVIKENNLLPAQITADYGGQNEEIIHAMKQLVLMMIVGLVLVYLMMVAQFQSLRSPLIIMFTIPLAFTGGLLALILTGSVFSVIAMLGFVMLMGIIVNNGIVLVDAINRFRLEGMSKREAIINAGSVRFRPVFMTAATTVLGLLPMAIGMGTGSEMIQPIAVSCIGGLIYGTITTLVVIPVLYNKLSKKEMKKIEDEELEIVTA